MATTVTTTQPREQKQKGVLKKMLRYLQDQAIENSNPRSFLSPPGPEPQQKTRSYQYDIQEDHNGTYALVQRRFSDATTAVESRHQFRRATSSNGVDASGFLDGATCTPKEMKKVQYAQDNILQNYRLYIPERSSEVVEGGQYWIIYIHGGYFRDPKVDAISFKSALEILTAEESSTDHTSLLSAIPESAEPSPVSSRGPFAREYDLVQKHIAGYASINYRLAPHPAYPQDESTENYVKRNAKFPDQLRDIHAAIRHLQTRHQMNNNYILAGHSVGATLAFLAALKASEGQIDPPACVVGLNGIYNYPELHSTHPDYESLTRNAMEPEQYQTVSPALYARSEYLKILPKQTLKVVLSHSKDDGMVDWRQVEIMQEALQSEATDCQIQVEVVETQGQHDSTWKEGRTLAHILVDALQMVNEF